MMLSVWTFWLVWISCMTEFHPREVMVDAGQNSDTILIERSAIHDNETLAFEAGRSITIVGNEFLLDGKQLQIVSGSLHYFRLPAEYWRDRLHKLKAAGFNAVATYVEWSYHEPEEREYRFSGDYDVGRFVRLAAEEGLLVLLRPGPYICAERDLGGLPYWLLSKYPKIKLRTADSDFISETKTWMNKLFEYMTPLLYGNGGPIILIQVENEYGSYGNSMQYKVKIRDIIKNHVSNNALLYTTDGTAPSMISGGAVPGTLTTIDFGTNTDVLQTFRTLRRFMPVGPLMNSEYYPGWLTHWGEALQQVPKESVVATLQDLLGNKTSVNMYVFFGGTNFEFSAGANDVNNQYMPDITSYDYDAPLSEAGDPTDKYFAIRELMKKFNPDVNNITPPSPSPKKAYGKVLLMKQINLLSLEGRSKLATRHEEVSGSQLPTFESLRQRAGFVLYESTLGFSNGILEIEVPRDRIYVYVDGEFQGVIDRMSRSYKLSLTSKPTSRLSLLVENQGRINYGPRLHDFKGILSEVRYNNVVLAGKWSVLGYKLDNLDIGEALPPQPDTKYGPVLHSGEFTIPAGEQPRDTFIDTNGWTKGYIWVNGHNLGRYWPVVGPQITLYVPGVWLREGTNTIQILELEQPPADLAVTLIDHPILNGKTKVAQ